MIVIQSLSGCLNQAPRSTITGHVIAEDGSSIPNVKVTYLDQEAFTDEEGYFSLDVSPGAGKLSLSKEGVIEVKIVTEAAADESIDTGTVVLPEIEGVLRIEEVTKEEYVPSPDVDTLMYYYTDKGFEHVGTIRVEYTDGAMNITALITSTSSAFVIESDGTGSIMFDFTKKTKEIRVEDFVLIASFGATSEEHFITLLEEPEWGSAEDEKEFQEIFTEKNREESEASEFIKSLMDIDEDSVHPDFLRKYGVSEENMGDVFLGFGTAAAEYVFIPQHDGNSGSRNDETFQRIFFEKMEKSAALQHDRIAGNITRNLKNSFLFPQYWGLFNTIVIQLQGVMNPPVNWRIIAWQRRQNRKFAALDEKRKLVFEQRELEAEKKKLEAEKSKDEDYKICDEGYKEELEEYKKELEEYKEYLEAKKKYLEAQIKNYSACDRGHARLKEEIEAIKKQIELIDKEIADNDKNIEKTENEIKKRENEIKENEDRIKKIEKRLKEIEQSKKKLDKIMEDC